MKKSLFVLILIGGWVIPSWAQNNKEFEQLCKKISGFGKCRIVRNGWLGLSFGFLVYRERSERYKCIDSAMFFFPHIEL